MEHRHGVRLPLDLTVTIGCRPQLQGAGRVMVASRSGALVRTRLVLPPYGRAQLQFVTRSGTVSRIHRLDAHVVRRVRGGVALEWDRLDAPDIAALLATATPPASASPTRELLQES
jgi:hypothetical protein